MNLISAEQWVKPVHAQCWSSDSDALPSVIRQIQANALRYVASYQFLQGGHPYIKDRILAAANQLDPQPPTP